jgi:hypothetical protein
MSASLLDGAVFEQHEVIPFLWSEEATFSEVCQQNTTA